MQTIYYQTSNFIRHQGNVVDMGTYRQRLDAVSGGHWVTEAVPADVEWESRPAAELYVLEQACAAAPAAPPRRKNSRRALLRFWLDVCVSGAVLLLSMTAVMQFLRFF